jgi:quinol monooxygenase YgiN
MTSRLLISEMHGLAGRADELEGLLNDLAEQGRRESGCLRYSILRRQDVGEFVVVAHWRDEAALREHYHGAPYARYRAAVGELLARPSDVTVHHVAETIHALDPDPPDPGLFG